MRVHVNLQFECNVSRSNFIFLHESITPNAHFALLRLVVFKFKENGVAYIWDPGKVGEAQS